LRQLVGAEEPDVVDLDRVKLARRFVCELTEERELPAVERPARAIARILLPDADELRRAPGVPGLLAQLLLRTRARRLARLRPAAGERPARVDDVAHEQHLAVTEGGCADVDLRAGVPGLRGEGLDQRLERFELRRRQLGGDRAHGLVALVLEGAAGVVQPVLRDRLQAPREIEPRSV